MLRTLKDSQEDSLFHVRPHGKTLVSQQSCTTFHKGNVCSPGVPVRTRWEHALCVSQWPYEKDPSDIEEGKDGWEGLACWKHEYRVEVNILILEIELSQHSLVKVLQEKHEVIKSYVHKGTLVKYFWTTESENSVTGCIPIISVFFVLFQAKNNYL